jgi:hypothetical protein
MRPIRVYEDGRGWVDYAALDYTGPRADVSLLGDQDRHGSLYPVTQSRLQGTGDAGRGPLVRVAPPVACYVCRAVCRPGRARCTRCEHRHRTRARRRSA